MPAPPVRRTPYRRAAWLGAAALLVPGIAVSAAAAPSPAVSPAASTAAPAAQLPTSWPAVPDVADRLQPWLARTLTTAPAAEPLRVMVSGETTAAATAAAQAAGLTVQQAWDEVGVVVAAGVPAQVSAVVGQPGVRYVEGDQPQEHALDTAHRATRSDDALAAVTSPTGTRVDGTGVTIAVIDSGIDSSHPMFKREGEPSKVVRNLKNACGITVADALNEDCFQPISDSDSVSAGGHGTHVAGIAAGYEVTTTAPAGTKLRGAAPGAKLVGLSVGAAIGLLDANAAMYWVLEHQNKPCKPKDQQDGAPEPECPPIRVTNHSYGPPSDNEEGTFFDEQSATVTLQRALIGKGVTPVWAAGNSGGDGAVARTNPPGMDPTPGVLMVASYDDADSGNRDNALSDFSSRGKKGDPASYPDLAAPGDGITSACRPQLAICNGAPSFDGGNYQTISGTSMATPYVAGVVAQLAQLRPLITPGQAEDVLEDTAHQFTAGAAYEADPRNADHTTSFDKGHGLVDVLSALTLAQALPAGGIPPQVRTLDSACPVGRVPANSQTDDDDNFHERAIDCMVWWEIAKGKSSTAYDPEVAVNREQMAAFVARLVEKAGGALPDNAPNAFSDDDTSTHHASINKLAAAGLVDGKGGGRFAPKETVSRAQMAKFIVNAYDFVSPKTITASRDYFGDDNGDTLESFINRSAEAGFTAGRNDRYEPRLPVLRDQMASFLARPLDLLVAEGTTPAKQ